VARWSHTRIRIAGSTRENVTIRESGSDRQYRFVMPGPALDQAEWEPLLEEVARRVAITSWVSSLVSRPLPSPRLGPSWNR
jgi:6-phosphofructokinase 2